MVQFLVQMLLCAKRFASTAGRYSSDYRSTMTSVSKSRCVPSGQSPVRCNL
ncbi:MAG: hypothetical protein MUO64_09785 [Anaerolineales bacterium]|nr:hypothetical protein [Anaerolineales bacterium]